VRERVLDEFAPSPYEDSIAFQNNTFFRFLTCVPMSMPKYPSTDMIAATDG